MDKLEYIKFKERFEFAIDLLKEKCKQENIPFDKDLLIEASETARCLFVRSEIQYSGKKS